MYVWLGGNNQESEHARCGRDDHENQTQMTSAMCCSVGEWMNAKMLVKSMCVSVNYRKEEITTSGSM